MKSNVYSRRSSGRNRSRIGQGVSQGQNAARQRNYAKQQLDKYIMLGRDARMSGDRTLAEGYFQHAEHFHRVYNELSLPATSIVSSSETKCDEKEKKEYEAKESFFQEDYKFDKSNKDLKKFNNNSINSSSDINSFNIHKRNLNKEVMEKKSGKKIEPTSYKKNNSSVVEIEINS